MSGKEFFVSRYEELGWAFREFQLRQSIRINTMNAEEKPVVERLESQGVEFERVSFLEHAQWVNRSRFSVGATTEYLLGQYSIQETAAQIPATLFTDLRNHTVLDACAAPGGKTVQLADLMQNTGAIVALDVNKRRLRALSNQLERCRVKNAIVYELDAREASRLNMEFDQILLDMPCSGNYASDVEWFRRRTLRDIERNASLQREILAAALKIIKVDGEIIYATCSLEPEENELNIDWATRTHGLETVEINCLGEKGLTNVFGKQLDKSIENCRRIWPDPTQGFFVCKLKKRRN